MSCLETVISNGAEFSECDEKTKDAIIKDLITRIISLEEKITNIQK